MPGFKFSFNLKSNKNSEYFEDVSPVYVTGAYKVTGEHFYGSSSYGEPLKKITPSMVKLPPSFQPDPTDPDVIKPSKSTGDLPRAVETTNPIILTKSTQNISSDPRGAKENDRQSTNLSNQNDKINQKEQKNLEKKRLAEQKKQEKLEAQFKAKQEKVRKEREKAEQKEKAKEEKLRIKQEKEEAAKAKKEKKVAPKTRTNPLAQGPNAPLPYKTNTLDSSISKTSGPPPYSDASKPVSVEARNASSSSSEVIQNENDNTGNTSFGAPVNQSSMWDMVAQHRVQVNRAPVGRAANKIAIRLQEQVDPESTAVTGRKSLYV